MGVLDRLRGNGHADIDEVRNALQRQTWQSELLAEDFHKLELALEDEGWRRMAYMSEREFTRQGLKELCQISRAMYLSNPLIQRAVNVRTYYTWGQGVDYVASEDRVQQEIVDVHLDNEFNQLELYSHQATILTDIDQQVDGNIFLALFTNDNGDMDVVSIPTDEVAEIIYSSSDRRHVRFYRRCWSQMEFDEGSGVQEAKQYEAFYPDIRYWPANRPETIGGHEVHWEAPVLHQRTGGLKHMSFGVPETYSALEWARAYKRFLEDWHTIIRSLARFSWRLATKGSKVEASKRKFGKINSRVNEAEETDLTKPDPASGGVFIGAEGDDFTPIPKTGAHTSAEDAKPSRLMVASAMDLPDTILSGDPQQGNLATAKSLDRPTELAMVSRQQISADWRARIFRYIMDAKVLRGRMPGKKINTPEGILVEPALDATVEVKFPPLLEHDVQETVNALVAAATLQGKAESGTIPHRELAKMLMSAVGVEDVEEALDLLEDEEQEQVRDAMDQLGKALRGEHPEQQPPPGQQPPQQPPGQEYPQ